MWKVMTYLSLCVIDTYGRWHVWWPWLLSSGRQGRHLLLSLSWSLFVALAILLIYPCPECYIVLDPYGGVNIYGWLVETFLQASTLQTEGEACIEVMLLMDIIGVCCFMHALWINLHMIQKIMQCVKNMWISWSVGGKLTGSYNSTSCCTDFGELCLK